MSNKEHGDDCGLGDDEESKLEYLKAGVIELSVIRSSVRNVCEVEN